jgi:biotin-dependent carboxylase-like uncharacterized protein
LSLRIHHASPLHTLQDWGRFGYQSFGVTTAGPLDCLAFSWLQRLLGHPTQTAAIEIIRGGFVAEFTQAVSFALTGADCDADLAGRPCPNWVTQHAKPGEILRLNSPSHGQVTYLSIAGGFDVKSRFGSVATSRRDQLGGLDGNGLPLTAGDELPFLSPHQRLSGVPRRFIPNYQATLILRFMPCYQAEEFSQAGFNCLLHHTYQVSHDISRMGYRLQGPPVPEVPPAGLSEPIAFGAIQIPPDGQPIVLLRDRQSLGGYPKIGIVMREDIGALCQRRPGDPVRWQTIDRQTCQERFLQLRGFFGVIV